MLAESTFSLYFLQTNPFQTAVIHHILKIVMCLSVPHIAAMSMGECTLQSETA